MGGIGSGGARAGSGQKPKTRKLRALQGNAGHRPLPEEREAPAESIQAPDRLTPKEQEYWNELSPHAIEAGTLVPATVAPFVLLCKCFVMADEMHATMLNEGLTVVKFVLTEEGAQEEKKIHPLVTPYRNMVQRIESLAVKYKVCALGKPMDVDSPKKKSKPSNPWAVVSKRA
jgi:phage terminase small subunit